MAQMSQSDESIINKILNQHSDLISDMGVLSNPPKGSTRRKGFKKYSHFFCDSIIFWCIFNYDDKGGPGSAIGKYVGAIRDAFKDTSLELDGPPKFLHTGLIHSNSDYLGFTLLRRDKSLYTGEDYRGGYIALKVSLIYSQANDVIPILDSLLPTLKKHGVVLHDIDLAKDYRNISTRHHVENISRRMVLRSRTLETIVYHGLDQ